MNEELERLKEDLADAEEAFAVDQKALRNAIHDCDADIAKIDSLKAKIEELNYGQIKR